MKVSRFLNKKLLIIIIIAVAAFLRFYQLGQNPPSLTWDETAWGYNAYSIGISGKDEFGRFMPLDYIESFGDFKPPMYAYLDIIPVKLLGLNEFAVRFPSVLFGILTVLMTYFLVRMIFPNAKKYSVFNLQFSIAELTALFLAISPWHILLSRAAFEANVASFFIVFGVWAFLAGVQATAMSESRIDKKWYLILSSISFAFSIYTFNTARIVSPFLLLILVIAFRKKLLKIKKQVVLAIIVGTFVLIPTVGFLFSPQAQLRFKEVNIFTDSGVIKTANQEIANDNNAFWSKIIHNRRAIFAVEYVKHYFDNLNPNFLFIKGDGNPKFSTQAVGQMYLWDLPFLIAGILYLIRKKEGNWWLVPLWIIIGIIPAATARETPHALRIETTLPMFQLLSAYGFISLILENKGSILVFKRIKKAIIIAVCLLLFFNFAYFYHEYFVHYKTEFSGEWQYGYKNSIDYVLGVQDDYDYVQVSNVLGRPYIYYLFYAKTDPDDFRKTAIIKRDPFGFVKVEKFGEYIFPEDFRHDEDAGKKVLYINSPYSLPDNIKVLKTFYLLNGEPILVAYTI